MQFYIRKSEPRQWGKKRGRPKGGVNQSHKYIAVITLPNGKKEYIYPGDVVGSKTVHDVVKERTSKHRAVANVEYTDYAVEETKQQQQAGKEKFKEALRTTVDKHSPDAETVESPLDLAAKLILERVNKKRAAQSEPHNFDIPAVDFSAADPAFRERVLSKYHDDAEEFQTELRDRPMTTLLTFGLTRKDSKGKPKLNDKEMAQLTAEWYWRIRNVVRDEMPAFRLTDAYLASRAHDETEGHTVEGRHVTKRKRAQAVAAGLSVPVSDTEKTKTKAMIDSLTAEYMGLAYERLRAVAEKYEPSDKLVNGKPSSFGRAAYRDIQLSVRSAANKDLRHKFGMTEIPDDVRPNIVDIDSAENPVVLRSGLAAPDEIVEHGEIAARGRRIFFQHFKKLPEAYRKILSTRFQIDVSAEGLIDTAEAKDKDYDGQQKRGGARGFRSFADIAEANPTWVVPASGGEKTVDLRMLTDNSQRMFLTRLEQEARHALRTSFSPKKGKYAGEEASNKDDAPLSREGKMAFRWLKLQAKLAERSVPSAHTPAKGTVKPAKFEDKPEGKPSKKIKLTDSPEVQFFVQRARHATTKDLETAIALNTNPHPFPDKLGITGALASLEGHTRTPNVSPTVQHQHTIGYLKNLYSLYQSAAKQPTPEIKKELHKLKEFRGKLDQELGQSLEPHEIDAYRRNTDERIMVQEYLLTERAALGKSLTLRHLDDVLDTWDFQIGRVAALR